MPCAPATRSPALSDPHRLLPPQANLQKEFNYWGEDKHLAADLLRSLLRLGPQKRLSAAEALSHPYFTDPAAEQPASATELAANLRSSS